MTPPTPSTATRTLMEREDRWQLKTYAKAPVALVEGRGCEVWDVDGKRYLDLYGGHCVALIGHGHPALVAAITEQATRFIFYSNYVYNDARAKAAERLCSLVPEGLRRVFFCNSGTEANETALKIARRATHRRHVVSMADGFHGRTLGSLGITGPDSYRHPSWPVPTEHLRVPYGDIDALAGAIGPQTAAVFLEPIPSMGGIRVAPTGWFVELRRLCDEHGALLVFDEVQTGFGRTGTMFFGEQVGVIPDLITTAKGIAGGMPAGAVFVRESVADTIGTGEQGTTFGGGPLASAAMAAVARVLVEEDLPAQAARVGAALAEQLSALDGVVSVTGRGLLMGINLDRPAKPVVGALLERGILVGGSGASQQIRLLPPLTLKLAQAQPFVAALGEILATSSEAAAT